MKEKKKGNEKEIWLLFPGTMSRWTRQKVEQMFLLNNLCFKKRCCFLCSCSCARLDLVLFACKRRRKIEFHPPGERKNAIWRGLTGERLERRRTTSADDKNVVPLINFFSSSCCVSNQFMRLLFHVVLVN